MRTTDRVPDAGETIVVEETGMGLFEVEVKMGPIAVLVDEPVAVGGLGSGPTPYDLLSAALGACTMMTIRLYADRKGWRLARFRVRVSHHRDTLLASDVFSREICLDGSLNDAQKHKLLEIADRCPVHLTLVRGAAVTTRLARTHQLMRDGKKPRREHMEHVEEACAP